MTVKPLHRTKLNTDAKQRVDPGSMGTAIFNSPIGTGPSCVRRSLGGSDGVV